jgi:octaprenyl-diphosphate synthase
MDMGIAFQLMDDVLDYAANQEELGKSIGHDLEEGKITLPLIHTLQHCNGEEKDRIADIVSAETLSDDDFAFVFDAVHRYGGIEFTVKRAEEYIARAKSNLSIFPASPHLSAFLDLADYVVTRQR